jgi:hypothetical protein
LSALAEKLAPAEKETQHWWRTRDRSVPSTVLRLTHADMVQEETIGERLPG